MSALSLATLGVQCTSRALSMASLGVFCGDLVALVETNLPKGGSQSRNKSINRLTQALREDEEILSLVQAVFMMRR